MAEKIEELKKDIAEFESLQKTATRQKVIDALSLESRKLATELAKLQEQQQVPVSPSSSTAPPITSTTNKRYEVKINNYAWDQSGKFVKFYVTLPKVQTIPQDNVACNFTEKSLELRVKDLDNKDYVFVINNLLNKIDPEKSSWKVKTDMVLVNAAKVKDTNWSHVTELEKKVSDAKMPKTDDMTDPGEGLMSLMKNMYEKGDDDMKRTIAKAWTESQMKQNQL